jgi:hypothetical protein
MIELSSVIYCMSFQSEDLVNFVGTHPAKIASERKAV